MRTPLILAFGGGVVGDLAGFVAAVYRRGVPYVQLPTTLLAQVDSAIGGKVGVDLPSGKNLAGAFYQPCLVWNQTALLRSLPPRQVRSGLSEIIKYGVIADAALLGFLERSLDDCLSLKPSAVKRIIERSCAIKARVVSQDERETLDVRIRLNFGHTIGHAIEAAAGYRNWTHGEAIAVGMCAASRMAQVLGMWPAASHERLQTLIARTGLATHACGLSAARVMKAMRFDKKFTRGKMRWVLPTRIGGVAAREDVPAALVSRIVSEFIPAKPMPASCRCPA
jgi:3-dehydroquinate synthase